MGALIQRVDGDLLTPGPSLTQRLENASRAADQQCHKGTMIMTSNGPDVLHLINRTVEISLQTRNTLPGHSMTIDATTINEHKVITIILIIIIEAASLTIEKVFIETIIIVTKIIKTTTTEKARATTQEVHHDGGCSLTEGHHVTNKEAIGQDSRLRHTIKPATTTEIPDAETARERHLVNQVSAMQRP